MPATEVTSNNDAKLKEEQGLMNNRNIDRVLEGTYKRVCKAQLKSFQLHIISLANTSTVQNGRGAIRHWKCASCSLTFFPTSATGTVK